MFQKLLSAAVLALGLIYAAVILRALYKNKRAFDEANGSLLVTGICEFAVFAISCFGISDFLMNTLASKRFRLADDKELPPSLVVCTVVPSSIIASRLIAGSESFGLSTLLICGGAVMLGSAAGSRIVTGLDGAKIKSIMRAALIASLGFLIVKMILSSGAPGTLTELSGARLAAAAVICFFCGVVIGTRCAMKRGRWQDKALMNASTVTTAIPSFFIALMLTYFLGFELEIFPAYTDQNLVSSFDWSLRSICAVAYNAALPVLSTMLGGIISNAQGVRNSVISVTGEPFIVTARAKGLSRRNVLYKHVLRNALLPIVTGLGMSLSGLIGGSVVIEQIFNWHGMGT
ncbi:MAG: ABC transporter permease, partial [Oscillospiraceae bacterium]|nr:ABC transporter permease [Oscillospiraceae bacterium]